MGKTRTLDEEGVKPSQPLFSVEDRFLLRSWTLGIGVEKLAERCGSGEKAEVKQALAQLQRRLLARAIRSGDQGLISAMKLALKRWPAHREKVSQAINALIDQPVSIPELSSPLWQWLHSQTAERLANVKVTTVGDLLGLIEVKGAAWWQDVPGVGEKKAERVNNWLLAQEESLNSDTDLAQLLTKHRTRAFGNTRSAEQPTSIVDGDQKVIERYLDKFRHNLHTLRFYRKELERFRLWSMYEPQRALSDIRVNDCKDYQRFLRELGEAKEWRWRQPREAWLGTVQAHRGSSEWRPFLTAPNPRTRNSSIAILRAFGTWLVEDCFWHVNPWNKVTREEVVEGKTNTVRHRFNASQWAFCLETLEQEGLYLPQHWMALARVRCLIYLAYGTALRLGELCRARLRDLEFVVDGGLEQGFWVINVIGKDNKVERVPLADTVVSELTRYLTARGFHGRFDELPGDQPLFARVRDEAFETPSIGDGLTVSTGSIYASLKGFFEICARRLDEQGDGGSAAWFRQASPHWLRHTHAMLGLQRGIGITATMRNLRLSDPKTISPYVDSDEELHKRLVDGMF